MSSSAEPTAEFPRTDVDVVSALRDSERRFQATFEQSDVAMAHRDVSGQFIRVNHKFCLLTGYERAELLARTVFEITHPADVKQHLRLHRQLVAGEVAQYSIEQRYLRKDGSVVWGRATVSAVRDDTGSVDFYSVVVQNVNEQRLLMHLLDKERRFVESIVDTAPVIILVLDTRGRVVFFNKFFRTLSGCSLDEAKGQDWVDLFIPADEQDRVRGLLASSLGGTRTRGNVNPIRTRGGQTRSVRWFDAALSDDAGVTSGVVAIGEDITEQLETEERLRSADQLATVGNLAAGLGHDMGNVVLGMRMAMAGLEPGTSPRAAKSLEVIGSGIAGLEDLCANLRHLVKNDGGGTQALIDPAAWWNGCASLFAAAMPAGVSLRAEFRAPLPPIRVNELMLMRALLNLTVNAAEAIVSAERAAGQVDIWASTDEHDPHFLLIGVRDNGPGIDPALLDRIFEPFFTANPSRKRTLSTGMGLTVVKSFVTDSGGSISVESALGRGTTFLMRLPTVEVAPIIEGL